MKKNIFVFIIGISACIAIFYLLYSTDKSIDQRSMTSPTKEKDTPTKVSSEDDIIKKQIHTLATNLEIPPDADKLFNDLNNYRIEISDLKKNLNKDFVKKYVKTQSKKIITCLKKDYCGTKPDADGYFDEFSTPGHILLSRQLRLLNAMLEDGDLSPDELDFSELVKFENKKFMNSTEIPTSGTFRQGDIVWNENTVTSGYIGWVCTRAGTPGEWRPCGQIG